MHPCSPVWPSLIGLALTCSSALADPPWLGSKEGLSDDVLPPWTPVHYERGTVSVWGREYRFSLLPFPEAVTTADESILGGPVRLRCVLDGRECEWRATRRPRASDTALHRVVVVTQAEADGISCAGTATIEYDGLIRTNVLVSPEEAERIDHLSLEIPIKEEHARYLYHFPGQWGSAYNAGALPAEGFVAGFRPYVWLGDEERGLAWFAESDQGFSVADPERVIEITRENGIVTLRINIITAPQPATAPLSYTFGFQATPVKPMKPDVWDYRICHHGGYGIEDQPWHESGRTMTTLDRLAELGVRTVCFHEHWTDIQNYTSTTHGEALHKLVEACHDRGIQLLLYFGYELSDIAPEWAEYSEECLVHPRAGGYKRQPEQTAYIVCYRSKWQDFLADGIAKVMDEYDIDGVYLDGTGYPWGCANTKHGCGHTRADGSTGTTWPIFAYRDMLRRIYTIVKSRKPEGQVNVHNSTLLTAPTLAWATSTWDGEQFGGIDRGPNPVAVLPLDAFRCEFMGRSLGVPAEFLCYNRPYTYAEAMSFTLLHDVLVRGSLGGGLEMEAKLWEGMEEFGRAEAEWMPYWRNSDYITAGPDESIKASIYSRGRRGAVVIVSNLGAATKTATVRLYRGKLELPRALEAMDMLTEEPVPIGTQGDMSFELQPFGFRVVWVKPRR